MCQKVSHTNKFGHGSENAKHLPKKNPFIVGSSSPPDPVPDPVITITETSESLSEAVGMGSTVVNEGSAIKLSLWLQWTLPKCCLTLHSVKSDEKGATLLNKAY